MSKSLGFTLLEILIALTLFVASLFSAVQLIFHTLHGMQNSYWHSVAELEAKKIAEQCTKIKNLNEQVSFWQSEIKQKLPLGSLKVETDAQRCQVQLHWNEHDFFIVHVPK